MRLGAHPTLMCLHQIFIAFMAILFPGSMPSACHSGGLSSVCHSGHTPSHRFLCLPHGNSLTRQAQRPQAIGHWQRG